LLDALVRGGVLVDDGPGQVELVAIVQVYGTQPGVTIEVWPLGGRAWQMLVPVTVEVGVLFPVGTVMALTAAVLAVFLVAVLAGIFG
jgi:hypothetical protein